ncbi:hypothetical protein NDN08_003371 [Rhodosorus marinus]|uniref:Nucleolar protein 16 n=1 Tax=Rhodosorus marinus TaxID=101924 RepID=A0AAV8UZZ6_9RHOD|nr:hypothetical protein NDN08_003371 [Rhodosorus marinus]
MGIRQRKNNRKGGHVGSRRKHGLKKKAAQRKGHIDATSIAEPNIQKLWEQNKTIRENTEKLGISLVANKNIKYGSVGENPSKSKTELVSLLEDRAARGEALRPDHLPEGEKLALHKLIGKYGTDYRKMARDMRLNSQQHTPAVLRKKCEKFLNEESGK